MGRLGAAEIMILLIPATIIYFLPMIIALSRNHPNKAGIILLNIFLGWTFLGWLASLIWSFTNPSRQTVIVNNTSHSEASNSSSQTKAEVRTPVMDHKPHDYDSKLEHLQKLKHLFDSGVLSEEEFAKEKAKVLNGN